MGAKYAAETQVSAEKSRAEIEATLRRYGASSFGYMADDVRAVVVFEASGRRIKFSLPLPDRTSREITHKPLKRGQTWQEKRTELQARAAYDQAVRQRWRALSLCIKAKLEAVAANIATFETEFLAYVVLPGGQTVGEQVLPRIAAAYDSGDVTPLLTQF